MPRQFSWISLAPEPPCRWDLRMLGWRMIPHGEAEAPILVDRREATAVPQAQVPSRWMAALGVDTGEGRAALLREGYGEALAGDLHPDELAARMERLAFAASSVPRHRKAGPVALDLFHRDGAIEERWLGLHPREFSLLWHLAEAPGRASTRQDLLAAIWRLRHDPGTNSLEVHVSRLRAKLNAAGAAGLVETDPAGGYRIAT